MYSPEDSIFIKKEEVFDFLTQRKVHISSTFLDRLFFLKVITVIYRGYEDNDKYVLRENIENIANYLLKNNEDEFEQLLEKAHLKCNRELNSEEEYSLLYNLLLLSVSEGNDSRKISIHLKNYENNKNHIRNEKKSTFARSAYYMGSKVGLRTFIMEGLSSIDIKSHTVVDLMTGSGVMAGTFANYSKTISSDAMIFSKYLSTVQGGGYSTQRATLIFDSLKKDYLKNYKQLHELYNDLMEDEESFLLSDDTVENARKYLSFLNNSRLYSARYIEYDDRLKNRKENPALNPYLLFTEYFANVYFGVNQAVQIDSIRKAIDSINDDTDKTWALGALIATCSHVASAHASHFAQPIALIDKEGNINYKNINKILMKRRLSVWREFEATFFSLAAESNKTPNCIDFVVGPWQDAIKSINEKLNSEKIMVYVDAPYKREEYSRYYHVLETLVNYNYPLIFGKGRQPYKSKQVNEHGRFTSDFFTKTISTLERVFIDLFVEILSKGWKCSWSYSNNGLASIVNILEEVTRITGCSITPFSTPYKHKSQNKTKTKNVEEYLFLMIPHNE